jgi:hypothetical protein
MWRWILGGIVAVIAGIMFITRYFAGVPELNQLTSLTGEVAKVDVETRRSRRSTSHTLAVRIGEHPTAYYPHTLPGFERLAASIQEGDRVTALVDTGDSNQIYQIEKDGQQLVSYEQVAEARKSNNRNNGLLGVLFLGVGVGVIGVMGWRWQTGAAGAG